MGDRLPAVLEACRQWIEWFCVIVEEVVVMVPYYTYTQTGAELLMVTLAHWVMLLAVVETVVEACELVVVELLEALSLPLLLVVVSEALVAELVLAASPSQ